MIKIFEKYTKFWKGFLIFYKFFTFIEKIIRPNFWKKKNPAQILWFLKKPIFLKKSWTKIFSDEKKLLLGYFSFFLTLYISWYLSRDQMNNGESKFIIHILSQYYFFINEMNFVNPEQFLKWLPVRKFNPAQKHKWNFWKQKVSEEWLWGKCNIRRN